MVLVKNLLNYIIFFILICGLELELHGQLGQGLLLDGCNNYMEVNASSSIAQGQNGLTIEAWILPNCSDENRMIVSKQWCNEQHGYYFSIFEGKLYYRLSQDGWCVNNNTAYETVDKVIKTGIMSHIAVVHNANSVQFFVNGSPVATRLVLGRFTTIRPSNEPVRIGAYKNMGTEMANFFSGIIDEVRIYNAPITTELIKERYNSKLVGNERNLVLYFDMEDYTGIGSSLRIQNKALNGAIHFAIARGFMTHRPKVTSIVDYLEFELELPDTLNLCLSNGIIDLKLDAFKDILWNDGSKEPIKRIVNEGTIIVNVETELCRFFRVQMEAVEPYIENPIQAQICKSDSIFFANQWIFNSGVYTEVYEVQNGCDSLTVLNLEVVDVLRITTDYLLCEGDSIWINNQWVYDDLIVTQNLTSAAGCDSIHIITVQKVISEKAEEYIDLCKGDSIKIGQQWYFETSTFENIIDAEPCPLFRTTYVRVNESYFFDEVRVKCPTDSFVFHNRLISEAGIYPFTYRTSLGCDSVYLLEVTEVEDPPYPSINVDCERQMYLLFIDEDDSWTHRWSQGNSENVIEWTHDSQGFVTYFHTQEDCEVEYRILLPEIPSFHDIPWISDTVIYPGKNFQFTMNLDSSLWRIQWRPMGIFDCDTCFENALRIYSELSVSLTLYHISGCEYQQSFIITTDDTPDLFIPNIFAPDGSPSNNRWTIFVPECFIIDYIGIYDRWGNNVSEMIHPIDIAWEGSFNGRKLEQGVYTYIIKYRDPAGAQNIKTGDVTLVR